MAKTLFLHIGFEKTGTTSLQQYLSRNRAMLREKSGILYPAAGCASNHWGLMAYALPAEAGDRIKWAKGLTTPEAARAFQVEFESAFAEEIAADPAPLVVMSLEQLSSRIKAEEHAARLKFLFANAGIQAVKVVAYLRPQAEFVTSWYSTQVKTGQRRDPFRLPVAGEPEFQFLTYLPTLELWGAVFGADALMIAPFQSQRMRDGNIVDDFLARIGAPEAAHAGEHPAAQNQSLDPATAEVLRRLNPHLGPLIDGGGVNPYRKNLRRLAEEVSTASRLGLSHRDTESFMAQFAESNAEIARRFAGGGPLFDPVRGSGEVSFYEQPLDMDQAFAVFAELLKAQHRLLAGRAKR